MYDSIIIGCGFAGATIARKLAESEEKVVIIEQRNHIGGNCYDESDENGILIHKYGPHIFHTNNDEVFEFLSRFTDWYEYQHEVAGKVYDKIIPIPFNLNTLNLVYGEEKGNRLKEKLIETYGLNARVPILDLKNNNDQEIKDIADYVYENIFLKYTMKQWGQTPEEIDPSVTARVPVLISYDNRYFQDKYQGMPLVSYTHLFENMLEHENITIKLNTNAKDVISVDGNNGEKRVLFEGKPFEGKVIFTGAIDEFFDCKYGRLPYRSLRFAFENYNQDKYQSHGVINYTVSEEFTRITEFKYLTNQKSDNNTTIMKEYPFSYTGGDGEIPYYSIINNENVELYNKYKEEADQINNFYLLGRLAEYKYYNIDAICLKALELYNNIEKGN